MPKASPWPKATARPQRTPREAVIPLAQLGGEIRLRQLGGLELMKAADKGEAYIKRHLTGGDGLDPQPLLTPTVPARILPVSERFFRIAAMLECMEVVAEGEEPYGPADWAAFPEEFPEDWGAITAQMKAWNEEGNPKKPATPSATPATTLPSAQAPTAATSI